MRRSSGCWRRRGRSARHASERPGVILNSYTVYLDLWVADATGKVLANGRPQRYPGVSGASVADHAWFRAAMGTRSGDDYAALDIDTMPLLGGAQVATYATAVREHGKAAGKPIGALGIFFDWQPQAAAVVKGVRLSDEEKQRTRCLILDAQHRVLAASDDNGALRERLTLRGGTGKDGFCATADGTMIGFALTPGYETYRGLGWYGVVSQRSLRGACGPRRFRLRFASMMMRSLRSRSYWRRWFRPAA
jgi:hypothetical protein